MFPLNLQHYLCQIQRVRKMDSLTDYLRWIPLLRNGLPTPSSSCQQLLRIEAMLLSMTPEERLSPRIIGAGRRARIARGSGASVNEVATLLAQAQKG